MPRRLTAALVLACAVSLAACTGDDAPPAEPSPEAVEPTQPPGPADKLGLRPGWGPSAGRLDAAARQAKRMSLPDLAGQVIVASYTGTTAPVGLVRSLHLGGVIAFSDNVSSAGQIRASNARLRDAVRRPLLIGVDQEGGIVERVQTGVTRFPAFMSAGAAEDPGLTRSAYTAAAGELRALGFDLDFAPVADVTIGPGDPAIGSRSASGDPGVVAEQVVAASRGYLAGGVLPVVKHFPGHGSVTSDSHETLPVQSRSRRELERADLVPFAAAVEAGLPAIMVGHLDVRAVDARTPSSLSRPVVTGMLRRELGFEGLVVTDALEMAAVTRTHGAARSAVAALRAGVDVLLMPPDPAAARAGIIQAVRRGQLDRSRLEQAAARQLALLAQRAAQRAAGRRGGGAAVSSARAPAARLSRAAITVASGPCQGRIVDGSVYPVGDPTAVGSFASAARAAGLEVLARQAPPAELTRARPAPQRAKKEKQAAFARRLQAWRRAEQQRRSALADFEADEDARLAAATSIGLSGYGDGPVAADIAVATDTPYALASSDARVRIATYGVTSGAMTALIDVLLGREQAPGRLPVAVDGVERRGC